MERMDECHMPRRVLMADASEGRVWSTAIYVWMDGVKVAFGSRRMTVNAARQCTKDFK